jgi:hypothetical protein
VVTLGLAMWSCGGSGYSSGNGGNRDLASEASSQPMAIAAGGGQYHCASHPVMTSVGPARRMPANPFILLRRAKAVARPEIQRAALSSGPWWRRDFYLRS